MSRPIFHLSFPVNNLEESKHFYCSVLGATIGRNNSTWIDIIFFGHQLTLHERPEEVLSVEDRGVRHFGVVLDWPQWDELRHRLLREKVAFKGAPTISKAGTPEEQGKMLLSDPSNNIIEIKSYRNAATTLGLLD